MSGSINLSSCFQQDLPHISYLLCLIVTFTIVLACWHIESNLINNSKLVKRKSTAEKRKKIQKIKNGGKMFNVQDSKWGKKVEYKFVKKRSVSLCWHARAIAMLW